MDDDLDAEPGPLMPEALRRRLAPYITDDWQEWAPCASADPEAWFPEQGQHDGAVTVAKRICAGCPVRRSCLVSALSAGELGVWAGTTAVDREALVGVLLTGQHIGVALTDALAAAVPDTPAAQPVVEPKPVVPAAEVHPFRCQCDYHRAAAERAAANRARKVAA